MFWIKFKLFKRVLKRPAHFTSNSQTDKKRWTCYVMTWSIHNGVIFNAFFNDKIVTGQGMMESYLKLHSGYQTEDLSNQSIVQTQTHSLQLLSFWMFFLSAGEDSVQTILLVLPNSNTKYIKMLIPSTIQKHLICLINQIYHSKGFSENVLYTEHTALKST